jgi:hypothetical protein
MDLSSKVLVLPDFWQDRVKALQPGSLSPACSMSWTRWSMKLRPKVESKSADLINIGHEIKRIVLEEAKGEIFSGNDLLCLC